MLFILISSIGLVLGLLVISWLHNQYQQDVVVERQSVGDIGPLISLCVPARNEERNIGQCLDSILAQTYPNFEILVVDDRSTDETREILRQYEKQYDRLTVVDGVDLPAGWAGKPHALSQAVASAKGEWLCFVDADTSLMKDALSAVYAKALETEADLFTIMTRQIMLTFWERAVLPLVMTALSVGFSPRKVNDPERKDAIANGQFILIRRSVYTALGGHETIRNSIVEDKDLAILVKRSGYRLVIADGRAVTSTRMYTSLPEMWEGWTKNIYLGLRDDYSLLLLGVFGAILAFSAALLLPAWVILGIYLSVAGHGRVGGVVLFEGMFLWGYLFFWRALVSRRMGIPTWYALTIPLGAGVFAAMMLTSTWNVLSGRGVTWKGRIYTNSR